jgi:hypothetical protein
VPIINSWPLEPNRYQKALANTPTYLAPEEIKFLEAGSIESSNLTE